VKTQHHECGTATDAEATHTTNNEESGHKPPRFIQSSDQAETNRTGLVAKEIRASIGVRKKDGVTLVKVESSGFVGTTRPKL